MSFSSTQNVKNLKDFIEKIPARGVPKKLTIKYLEGLGYKSTNDRSIVSVIKSLGLVGSDGVPTSEYSKLRSASKKTTLGQLIKKTYPGLFEIYPNAEAIDEQKLKDYFASVTDVGEAALKNIIKTFQTLCEIADFGSVPQENSSIRIPEPDQTKIINPKNDPNNTNMIPGSSQIHFNIQVHIPGEQSPETYESIFKNLGKYVLGIKNDIE